MISQPRYLPGLSYLHRISLCDLLISLDTVQYTPRDWENRNRIKSPTGPLWLSVPVVHEQRSQLIRTTRVGTEWQWQMKHLRSLEWNYRKAPHFENLYPELKAVLQQPWSYLVDLNIDLTAWLLRRLDVSVPVIRASELGAVEGSGSRLLSDLCRAVGATTYLSGPLGRNYISTADFTEAGVQVAFHDYVHPVYPQLHGGFLSNLSSIDLMFNVGPDAKAFLDRDNLSRTDLLAVSQRTP